MDTYLKHIITFIITAASVSAAANSNFHDLKEIEQQVIDYAAERFSHAAEGEVEIEPITLDNRLKLEQCAEPLQLFSLDSQNSNNRFTIGVKCLAPKPWKIYMQVRAKIMQPILVVSRPIARGEVINADDISAVIKDINQLNSGYFTDMSSVVGEVAKYSLNIGKILNPKNVIPPKLIKRGEEVMIYAGNETFSVKSPGIAMSDGRRDQRIQVKNKRSNRVIEATVTATGKVEVRI